MSRDPIVTLVDASPDDVEALTARMPNWTWLHAPADCSAGAEPVEPEALPDAVMVFGDREDPERTRALCQEIRQNDRMSDVPLLVAIDRYQMTLGNEVRELPNAHFVITPIEEERLRERLQEMRSRFGAETTSADEQGE